MVPSTSNAPPKRFVGLDIHKHYLVAVAVDAHQRQVFGPHRVAYTQLTSWLQQHLTHDDAVVLEMTTNTFQIHDELQPHVQSVTVVHLPVSPLEQARIQSDLATLVFAEGQVDQLEDALAATAANDRRVPLLIQLPGIQLVSAVTILAAIGDIARFPTAQQLMGYAGLGARVHDSGQLRRTGRITKAGRRDLRHLLVEAAHSASRSHPHWQSEFARLSPRLGHGQAIVAIARKLLIAVWHVLAKETVDCHAQPYQVARSFMVYGYRLGRRYRPHGQPVPQFVRTQLDRLGIGTELTVVAKGPSTVLRLPPSQHVETGPG